MKSYILILYISIVLACVPDFLSAQHYHGEVFGLDERQEKSPLPGVSIYWSGTTLGTSTNSEGEFHIDSPNDNTKYLVFRFMGYKTDTIDVTRHAHLEIILQAENKQLGEVVIRDESGGAYISKLNARKVEVITHKELARAACCNLSESFESNASVDVNYSDAITGAKQIQLLGLSGVYSQVISENTPLIRGLGTSFGLNYIPGPWMESIQVSKGASSVLNGYESITGQINVEYKKPASSEPLYVNLFVNDWMRKEANANSRYAFSEKLSTMVFGHYSDQQKKADHNHDGFMDHPLVRTVNLFNRWDYLVPGKGDSRFGIKYLLEDRVAGMMDFNPDTYLQDTAGIENLSKTYGISMKTKRAEAFWKNGLIFDGEHYRSLALIVSGIYHDQSGFLGLNHYNGLEKSFNANLIFSTILGHDGHKITTGLSYQFSEFKETYARVSFTYLEQAGPWTTESGRLEITGMQDTLYRFDRNENVPGAFLEYTFQIPEKLSLIGGLRADHHQLHGTIVTPRFHARYIIREDLTIRASAGKGSRLANLMSENFSLMASQRSLYFDEPLRMEQAWNFGLNLTKDFLLLKRKAQLDLEYYRTSFINQLIVDMDSMPSAAFFYNLEGKSFSNSIQAQITYEAFTRFNLLLAYRLSDVWTTIGKELRRKPFVNRYKALATLSYATRLDKWKFDITGQWNGKARIPDTRDLPVQLHRPDESPAYFIVLAQVSRKFKHVEIYLGGENLGDFTQKDPVSAPETPYHTYFDTSMVWGPITGRMLYAGIRWTLQ